jgi:hypothetical protein
MYPAVATPEIFMEKTKLTDTDLKEQLADQCDFLKESVRLYLSGNKKQYKRVSASLRILFHDTKNQKSLVGRLPLLDAPMTTTAGKFLAENEYDYYGLTAIRVTSRGASHVPKLNRCKFPRTLSVSEWWSEKVLAKQAQDFSLTRAQVVTTIADKYGGAHVDNAMPREFMEVLKNKMLFVRHVIDINGVDVALDVNDLIPPTMIQIAYEAANFLDPSFVLDLKETTGRTVSNHHREKDTGSRAP